MKKSMRIILAALALVILFSGCSSAPREEAPEAAKTEIPFSENQLYAVAYLGYNEMDALSFYTQKYFESDDVPVHYLSQGEYYLIVPRYPDTQVSLYKNDIEAAPALIFEDKNCQPFIVQCNVSDIFPDASIRLSHDGDAAEFSPFISLKDGTVVIGERGLNITKPE